MSGKRHHFIPQFLQRGFASHNSNKDYYTWVYRKEDVNPFNTNIKNVGLEGYFYAEDKESTLDDMITDAETEYAIFVDELRNNDGVITIDNIKAANLIAHLEVRTKNLRDSFRNAGTLLLEEMTNFLQDQANCEHFIKKHVAIEASKLIEQELKKRKVPSTLFPIFRQQFAPLIKEKIPEMTENLSNMMVYISQNIPSMLEKSAKSGHIKALLSSHTPQVKASFYEKLNFQVVSTGNVKIPLGDSSVIFNIEGKQAYKQYFEIDKKLIAVLLPISSTKLLVGSSKNYSVNVNEIPYAVASCSLDYFITSEQNADNDDLAKHISDNARMISESEIEDILSDLMMAS